MKQTNLMRLKRIERTQSSAGLDPQTERLFEPIFAIVLHHFVDKDLARHNLTRGDILNMIKADLKEVGMLSDAELHRCILHNFGPRLDDMFIAAGGEPRNGRELNAWVQSPATVEVLETLYNSLPAEFKKQGYFPDTLSDHLEQVRKSAAKAH